MNDDRDQNGATPAPGRSDCEDETQLPKAEVFIDLQNFNSFLSSCCGVNPFRLHIVNFMKEWLHFNGMSVGQIRIYTGVPDERIEPARAEAVHKRLSWLHGTGARIFTHKMAYSRSRENGEQRGREKGVDVRLASELVEAVAVRGVRRVVVVTQDRDLVQGLDVARNICMMRGEYLHAFSPELRDLSRLPQNDDRAGPRCAHWGIPLTGKLEVPLDLVDRYTDNLENNVRHEPVRVSETAPDEPAPTAAIAASPRPRAAMS